ncbi:MAG: N(4)-(beta-N-acetylglucosaminyl)-L-asparaginase [Acidobacteriota bacterium]
MNTKISRRNFVRGGAFATVAASLGATSPLTFSQAKGSRPVVVSSANGIRTTEKAMQMLRSGADTLDAVIAGVNIVEDDPKDMSVGYGGLPNEEGDVELDASVMHGPSRRAGAVASLRNIKNPSKVARVVMDRSEHVLLVGEGALRFAIAHGFKKEELLTEETRFIWLRWKEAMSDKDGWGPGLSNPDKTASLYLNDNLNRAELLALADRVIANRPTGTINCLAINERGDISGTTTTSGLAFKIPGRVGDSPLIGCGLYVDNDVGAAGSTGLGEECIKINGSHTVVELMRQGKSPTEACLEALKRIVNNYHGNMQKLRQFNVNFYAVNKNGEYGAGALWGYRIVDKERQYGKYAVHDGRENKLLDIPSLYESPES